MLRVAMSTWSLHNAPGCLWHELDTDGKTLITKTEAESPALDICGAASTNYGKK